MRTTYSSVLEQVRRQIKDEAAAVLDDVEVQGAIVDALRELGTTHPDARLDSYGRLRSIPEAWPEDPQQPVPIDEYYVAAIVALALAKLFMRDGWDFKDEALAKLYMSRYTQLAGG